MITQIKLAIAGGVGMALTAAINWVVSRKKQDVEVDGEKTNTFTRKIDNEIKIAEYYKTMLEDLSIRYESKFDDVVKLFQHKEKILNDEIALLNRRIKLMRTEITELKKRNKELEKTA